MTNVSNRRPDRYIPGIDGLRAIAVVAVILYHLDARWLPSGFIGVDIFFVISGFVVAASVEGREFPTFRNFLSYFYVRRITRVLPALVTMLLLTSLVSVMFIPEMPFSRAIMRTGVTAFFGLSNIVISDVGETYFEPISSLNPFLHTWSLGVEEQFYLFFPLIIYFRRLQLRQAAGKALALAVVLALTTTSLAICAIWSFSYPTKAFYLLPTRFWELGLGLLLSLTRQQWEPSYRAASPRVTSLVAASGLALVTIGIASPVNEPFPFPFALLPALGTAALIVHLTALRTSCLAVVLSARAPRQVGLWSYSLYLWHWPVIVMLKWTVGLEKAIAVLLIVVLSIMSFYLVEQPARNGGRRLWKSAEFSAPIFLSGTLIFVAALAGSSLTMFRNQPSFSLSVTANRPVWHTSGDLPLLFPEQARCKISLTPWEEVDHSALWKPQDCQGARHPNIRIIAVGDSHNLAYAPIYKQLAADLGVEVISIWQPGCAVPEISISASERPSCVEDNRRLLANLDRKLRPGDVVFLSSLRLPRQSSRWTSSIEPDQHRQSPPPLKLIEQQGIARGQRFIDVVKRHGGIVVFELPKPVFSYHPFRCSDWFNRSNPVCNHAMTVPKQVEEDRRAPILKVINKLKEANDNVRTWDSLPALCPGEQCRPLAGSKPTFFDGDHVSGYGNKVVYTSFKQAIIEALKSEGA